MTNSPKDNREGSGTRRGCGNRSEAKDLENKITIAQQQTLGLRQAINPSKPEEILTIARLTDELKTLRKEAEGFISQWVRSRNFSKTRF